MSFMPCWKCISAIMLAWDLSVARGGFLALFADVDRSSRLYLNCCQMSYLAAKRSPPVFVKLKDVVDVGVWQAGRLIQSNEAVFCSTSSEVSRSREDSLLAVFCTECSSSQQTFRMEQHATGRFISTIPCRGLLLDERFDYLLLADSTQDD